MLAHPEESLLIDGRALSDLRQGVTLEVIGEDSMGPLSPEMKRLMVQRQADVKFPVDWTTLGEYLDGLEKRGISPNVAAFVGAGTVRVNVLGERDVQPTPAQLEEMRKLVHQAMEDGAMGVTTALIYAPNAYAWRNEELTYIANTIMAGCSLQGRAFATQEAWDAAAAVCNLGLENWSFNAARPAMRLIASRKHYIMPMHG